MRILWILGASAWEVFLGSWKDMVGGVDVGGVGWVFAGGGGWVVRSRLRFVSV